MIYPNHWTTMDHSDSDWHNEAEKPSQLINNLNINYDNDWMLVYKQIMSVNVVVKIYNPTL